MCRYVVSSKVTMYIAPIRCKILYNANATITATAYHCFIDPFVVSDGYRGPVPLALPRFEPQSRNLAR